MAPIHIVASACDIGLLRLGSFTDVTVQCGDQSWPLHRAILMTRCPFFDSRASEAVIKIDDQDPKKVFWVIYFIYTAKLPKDLLALLKDERTVMSTCIDLVTLAKYFNLEGLRERAVDVYNDVVITEAYFVQQYFARNGDIKGLHAQVVESFSPYYLGAIREVYGAANSDDLKPLKEALLRYPYLTCNLVLRKELLGHTLRTDQQYVEFFGDVLDRTICRPFGDDEYLDTVCTRCKSDQKVIVVFGDTIAGHPQAPWCRKCKPLGEENLFKLLSGPQL
ncbi:hypothetical protein F4859DRAFT_490279 [Xylaria cf. heliscus]|nr:hypothetical protein F4859DRAFT_490279 [Xylaria cf. heliscus]